MKKKVKEKTGKGAKFREKFDGGNEEKSANGTQKTVAEIVTGKGLSVPMCDGEEVVSSFILDAKLNFLKHRRYLVEIFCCCLVCK